MSKFFEETMIGLLQAVAIEKGYLPVEEVSGMPAKTYRVKKSIDVFSFDETTQSKDVAIK